MSSTPAEPGLAGCLCFFGFIGLLGSFVGFFSFSLFVGVIGVGVIEENSFQFFCFLGCLVSAILTVGGVFLAGQSPKEDYHVSMGFSSGESNALTSKDKNYIAKIVLSINDAIVRYE